ncbi:hypothetical protein K402DRAFT_403372 [Aulographum hederae CBS 113979]|uniref:Uncharacterized protein n=1 Tax=Aulographum hederae CBS 113979 TaxID=1176131 RepID=A0A6G1H3Q3_9PEZI|nr:hypothetical protein K402DRAFT_403372 [Aulographum hederae CBS 113979]
MSPYSSKDDETPPEYYEYIKAAPESTTEEINLTVPQHGSTFIISHVLTRQLITLLRGELVLAPSNSLGSSHWECIEVEGGFGFRNVVSGRLLGRNRQWGLICEAHKPYEWEKFYTRSTERELMC